MATSTVNTNKPIIPRGVDDRPVDKYNRASLFSGKALSFDGVNDYIEVPYNADTRPTNAITLSAIVKLDDWNSSVFERVISCTEAGGWHIANGEGSYIPAQNTGMLIRLSSSGYVAVYVSNDILKNEYNYLTTTFDGRYLKMYVNGVLTATTDSGTTQTITYAVNNSIYIGAEAGGGSGTPSGNYIDGQISSPKVFDVALTAAQVADLYNNPEKIVPTGVSDSALKLWLPMQEGAGTMCANGAPDALGSELVTNGDFDTDSNWTKGTGWSISGGTASCDGSQSDNSILYQNISHSANKLYQIEFTISGYVSGQIDFALDTPFFGATSSNGTFIFNAIPPSGGNFIIRANSTFVGSIDNVSVKEVQNSGVISGATWTHGIGAPVAQTAVIDWNKHTLDGTNEVLIPQGLTSGRDLLGNLFENVRKQGALNLDGNSWAEVHDNASLDFGTGSFSLEAWVKAKYTSSGSVYNAILTLGGDIVASNNCGIALDSSLKPYIIYNANASVGPIQNEGDWVHIVGNYDGTKATLYVNGSQVDQDTISAGTITNTNTKMIGKGASTNRIYSDQIAQPRIYNRALTASEVLNNYNATKTLYI